MSESYTIGGNAYQGFDASLWVGQVFSPIQDHTLEYIDLNIKATGGNRYPEVQVHYWTGTDIILEHILSHSAMYQYEYWGIGETRRIRIRMSPFLLTKGDSYAIVLRKTWLPTGQPLQWQYDKDAATYPRGYRILSNDNGVTWTRYLDQDHIFVEFGNPPLSKPEPPPPIANFAPTRIYFFHRATSITTGLATSVPCHLSCYWTDKKPRKHHTTRIVRGLTVPWGTYFCFVAWKAVEQNEAGDTLYHTFDLTPWQKCQTRWFTFRGDVDDILSPSVGPIFEHHHPGATLNSIILRPNAPGDWCGLPHGCTPCPNHYLCVDDVIPDEGATWVRGQTRPPDIQPADLYHIETPPFSLAPIYSADITARCRGVVSPTAASSGGKTNAGTFLGPLHTLDHIWRDYTDTWTTNPITGNPWTWTEIASLQIGLRLVRTAAGLGWAYCTQEYIKIFFWI